MFLHDDHGQRADDIEGRHHDDQDQQHEHHELLEFERREEVPVHFHPVPCPVGKAECLLDARRNAVCSEDVRHFDFDAGDGLAEIEEFLCLRD